MPSTLVENMPEAYESGIILVHRGLHCFPLLASLEGTAPATNISTGAQFSHSTWQLYKLDSAYPYPHLRLNGNILE
ncbi:hypothetical protein PM082_010931 [Marasmius tenuissimus]|nr:hypothetical protein PM082_010931 [Marasmius tenuissimus]